MNKKSVNRTLKDLLLFPFKVILRVVEISAIAIAATVIPLALASFSMASQPMVMPEAQNMTYKEFLADREKELSPFESEIHKTTTFRLPVVKAFFASIPATFSTLLPEQELDKTFRKIPYYYYIEDENAREWNDLPGLFWETFERASWAYLVFEKPETKLPKNPNAPQPTLAPGQMDDLHTEGELSF